MLNPILDLLNEKQREACKIKSGPILIIAGAGSGKTRTLTHRVAYLIQEGINPENILAVTFTNKAANEMKERIQKLLINWQQIYNLQCLKKRKKLFQQQAVKTDYLDFNDIAKSSMTQFSLALNYKHRGLNSLPTIGTFHSVCAKILRKEIDLLGYKRNFAIYDEYDQISLIKDIIKEQALDLEKINPETVLAAISSAKNELIEFDEYEHYAQGFFEKNVAKIYECYQKSLKFHNALDFDDLIMLTCKLFKKHPKVLAKYQEKFKYILVDEYQDTNHAQYEFINLLAKKHRNICVVGDDWQGIYGWRGANIQNILNFEKDYPEAKIIKLEQNYRSTQNILDASHNVIIKNVNQKEKRLWTKNNKGEKIIVYEARDEKDEAEFVIKEINKTFENFIARKQSNSKFNSILMKLANFSKSDIDKFSPLRDCKKLNQTQNFYNNFVVLYRTHAQSRVLEEVFLNYGIPYRIVGGIRFYERAEIKDAIAFLKIIQNQNDVVSVKRVINVPPKNIGAKTFFILEKFAKDHNLDLISAAERAKEISEIVSSSQKSLIRFAKTIRNCVEESKKLKLTKLIDFVLKKSGYRDYILDGSEEGEVRFENIQELKSVARKFDDFASIKEALCEFLEEVSLISSIDELDERYRDGQENDAVTLMTVHSAKGLEYDTVFICGLEENIFPHSKSMLEPQELEEERRLCYVGMTRAKRKLYLIYARKRQLFGYMQVNLPSRFIEDIPERYIKRLINFKQRHQYLN